LTLSRLHTFPNFVRANSNQTAFEVAEGLANGTMIAANPLCLFGPTGMGKTHLLQAIVWRLLERDPGKRVLYLTADGFLHLFLTALRAGDTPSFKDLVREVDVCVIEDVQKLSGKTATTEEFFHTLDDLIARGKQVILSADGSPSLMAHLPERMRSRLVSGGGVEILPGDFTLRLALLNAIVKRRAFYTPSVSIDGQVLGMIAARLQTDARPLTSAIERLISMSQDGAEAITFKNAEAWLRDFLREYNKTVSINDIKKRVTAFYKMKPGDVESICRQSKLVRGRQVVMYLARTMTPRSYPEIGKTLSKDHTTVMHGFERIRKRRLVEPDLDAEIEAIKRSIRDHANDPGKNNSTN
jgi:chromosomal replication initiator protein